MKGPFIINVEGPIFTNKAELILTTQAGDREILPIQATDFLKYRFTGKAKVQQDNAKPGDGILQVKSGDVIKVQYGYGIFKTSVSYKAE